MNNNSADLISADLSFLIDGIPIPCIIVNEDGFIVATNKACCFLKNKGIDLKSGIAFNFYADTKDSNIFEILKSNFSCGKNDGQLLGLELNRGASLFIHVNINKISNCDSYLITLLPVDQYINNNDQISSQRDFYKNILDNLPADIAVFDPDFRYSYLNKNAIKDDSIRSWTIGKTDIEYCKFRNIPIEVAQNRQERLLRIRNYKEEFSFDETIDRNDQVSHHLRIMKPVTNHKEELSYIIGYGINITPLKEAELKNQEQAFAIEASLDGIAILNSDQSYVYMNQAHSSLFGYENREELIGKTWSIFYEEQELNRILSDLIPKLQTEHRWRGETKAKRKDDTYINIDVSLTVMENGGLVCVIRDITDRKEKEKELRKLAIVASQSNSLVVICDKYKRIEWINKALESFSGFGSADLLNIKIEKLISPEYNSEEKVSYIKNCLSNNKRFIGEIRFEKKSGEICWLTINATPVLDNDGIYANYVIVANDISLLKETEENYKELLEKEKELNKLKSQFISLASHEFRTPLASILSSVDILDILNSNHVKETEKINKHLNRISNEVDRMTNIMTNIFQIGKMELIRPKFEPKKIDLSKFINEILVEFKFKKPNSIIELEEIGTKYHLVCDKNLVLHILNNLLDNSIKYSNQKDKIFVKVIYFKSYITISIIDNGIGIPKKDQEHLFNSFYRASNSYDISGTGLGLVVVKQFMELHNGEIEVNSDVNKGCTIKLIFKAE
jgi:PAS domain S-box-containing protein